MKAGIVTIYDTENIGNRLQNYALQQTLLRYADEVVSLKNKPRLDSWLVNLKQGSALADSVPLNRLLGKTRKAKLLRFNRKYIRLSHHCYRCNDSDVTIAPQDRCDVYCAGSDQIWNPAFFRSGMFNYLGFSDRESAFSYAASFGVDEIPEDYHEDVRKGLMHLKYISVREEAGKRIVETLTGRTDAQVVVDPTLLLSEQDWLFVAKKPSAPVPERYHLLYFLGHVPQSRNDAICRRAQETGHEIVDLLDPEGPFYQIGPDEFLYLLQHADTVCTDSFHASVFSFLFGRPLVIFERVDESGVSTGMGSRLATFSETFHLENCLAQADQLPDIPEQADYSAGMEALEAERAKAHRFLRTVFSTRNCEVPV